MNISVVIPLFNEEESLPELHDWIKRVMDENKFTYEILFVDDGSKDKSWQVIESIAAKIIVLKQLNSDVTMVSLQACMLVLKLLRVM